MAKEFRFGLGLHDARSRSKVENAARSAEEFGFDVLHCPTIWVLRRRSPR
jgi:hypothetical protein